MNLRLDFTWDIADIHPHDFSIDNPPTIPSDGDPVDFEWADYISDSEDLKYLEDNREEIHFKVVLVRKKFSKDLITIDYVLVKS